MRKIILFAIGVVILVGAVLGANYIVKNNEKQKPEAKKVIKTVFVEEVKNSTVPIILPANGNLVAKNRLEIYSEVQGIFESSSNDFKAGQHYQKGQTLIRMNSSEYYASVQAAKSEFYNLITSLMPDLRLDYPDAFPVWNQYLANFDMTKSVPNLPEMTSEKVRYFITGRGVSTSYFNVKNLEQRLGKYSVRAPFNGIVTEALVTRGTLIRSGQKLGEFIDTSVFELELSIAKEFSDLLKIGEKVQLNTVDTGKNYTGTVVRINGRINQATQTINVFVEVKGTDLKEGMYLEAQLEANEVENAIQLPRKLLVDENKLFVVKDSILSILEIDPVYFSPNEVVVKGVPDGTKILSKPVPGAYSGMLVKIGKGISKEDEEPTSTTKTL
ncbi:efflux RND transporter periplasmic adaptor subunit [Ulvibacter litoralis]|uniref:Multidrug efflux pump subunit AcrA (Membrane-fusion protein) n=1 Tax=Ulvibacter litoralis TaxID=227084 RepID=A0A1G7CBF6_9FLAO|nr:HlyD family efflux transporter periplasmic adaptor subunit [Ulvibacter litoralis]GHC47977.1 hypothetical protein GCM10008083_09050 [Ulvibacter litoralis]SDE36641.1 Multidrug efflux pump subunit AcrA (membrane-fusion protein) [Ulvibacter litoralis]